MLRRSSSPSTDVSLSVSPKPLYPGDLVDAEIIVTPRNSFLASVGVLRLSQTEVLRIDSARDVVPHLRVAGRTGPKPPRSPDHIDHVFVEDEPMDSGVSYRFPAQLRLPVPAPPTVKGKHARITWELTASILAKSEWMGSRDGLLGALSQGQAGASSQELVVFARPDAANIGGERLPDQPSSNRSFRNMSLDLALDSGLAVNGGELTGILAVATQSALSARELRVELVRWERSGNKQARVVESRLVLQRPAAQAAGERTEWAFRLPVPDRLMPSVMGNYTFVGWQVRAVISRTLLPSFSVSQMVQVYTAPETEASRV